jgi:hypothetical protein
MTLQKIVPPWTKEQVDTLNAYQASGVMHAFTCVNRDDGKHEVRHGDTGTLTAREDGWHCEDCGYIQRWAHAFMADAEWLKERIAAYEELAKK